MILGIGQAKTLEKVEGTSQTFRKAGELITQNVQEGT